jgi:hypothetical protein
MAGTRGVVDLMQRTALQASPRVLDSLRSTPSSLPAGHAWRLCGPGGHGANDMTPIRLVHLAGWLCDVTALP